MSIKKEMEKTYESADYEAGIYKKWEESGYFNPDNLKVGKDQTYCIVMPPPNVTGVLHMGHSAMLALEDILTRHYRMQGHRTLWVPGTDHAAIATQTKVEKILQKEGTNRHKLGKEKFLERVKEFASQSHDTIEKQIKKMGCSCDWSREAYTLDAVRTKAVRAVFKMMYEDGLIYRGDRVVNWCPRCHSTLADDEVEYKEQKAKLYTFKYSKDFPFTIATTRPETKLGDTAVAVNPRDERYKEFIGKSYEVNFLGTPLKIKIIADREVDMEFGTGALGVTPAHSLVDWQMAEKNDLGVVKVIDEDGNIAQGFGEFSGKSVYEARKLIVQNLKEAGLLESEEEADNKLSLCYRCDTPIEPLPSLQWFINVNKKNPSRGGKSIKELSIDAVKSGVFGREKINIYPQRFEKSYFQWMDNLKDWCISRQILFGHQIPVWYRGEETYVGIEAPEGDDWVQDSDTLDTWFSSGLWTFSTLAQTPAQIRVEDGKLIVDTDDFKNYHPTSVLETGYDILFFWVARMIIMTTYAIEDIPFADVYLHGLVLDEKGKKMSKSKDNAIDPLDMIEKYGTDATRLSLVIGSTPGQDLKISEEKIAGYRNFTNKLWNISRFIITAYGGGSEQPIKIESITAADKWILNKKQNLITQVTGDLKNYRFSQAGERLREFTWGDLADWYLEISKFEKGGEKEAILQQILQDILKLWHPFMPFVTEAIWESAGYGGLLMMEGWPVAGAEVNDDQDEFELIKQIIIAIRNARAENKVEPAKKIKAVIYAGKHKNFIQSQEILIKSLRTGLEEVEISETGPGLENAIYVNAGGVEIYLLGAIDAVKEKQRIEAEIINLETFISKLKAKLENKEFVEKAPEKIIKQEQDKLTEKEAECEKLKQQVKILK